MDFIEEETKLINELLQFGYVLDDIQTAIKQYYEQQQVSL